MTGVFYIKKKRWLLKIDFFSFFRTPVDQISGSFIKDLRPVQTQGVHQSVIGGGGEGDDDDVNDLTGIIDFCLLNLTIKYCFLRFFFCYDCWTVIYLSSFCLK